MSAPDPIELDREGLAAAAEGRVEEARDLYERALALDPGTAAYHDHLGVVLRALGDLEGAEQCHLRAIELAPELASAHNNLASVRRDRGDGAGAEASYRRALEIDPTFAIAQMNMGHLRASQERYEEAAAFYRSALKMDETTVGAYHGLAAVLSRTDRESEAPELYRRWLEHEPDSPIARHMAAAIGLLETPPRADDEYIKLTFDAFADTFDEVLARLEYRAPTLLAHALDAVLGSGLVIFDAGCGTGLCGALLKKHAARLIGVDLSPAMIARATARGIYDELAAGELTEQLAQRSSELDVVVSADVLCYFGDLHPVARAAHRALRAGGWFAFTVERADEGCVLHATGRWAHSEAQARDALNEAGFARIEIAIDVLRQESGHPVHGLVVLARK